MPKNKDIEEKIDTHNLIVDFGRHKGERWTRIPVGYLKWLVKNVGRQRFITIRLRQKITNNNEH